MPNDQPAAAADRRDSPAADKPPTSPWRWVHFHVGCLILAGLVWRIDAPVFHFFDRWYNGPKPPTGELHQLILSSAMFGQTLGMVLSVLLVWRLDNRKDRAATIVLVLIGAAVASSMGKMLVGRERPQQSNGETVLHGPWKGPISSRQQSMPSGHTTTAAALAVALMHFYPRLRGVVLVLAAGVAFNRVITVAHYPSDVVAGAWLGRCVATWMLGRAWLCGWSLQLASIMESTGERLIIVAGLVRMLAQRALRAAAASPLLPALAGLALFWGGNDAIPLWDRDEPRFATAAREMLERNDWVVPTFNGDLRPDKPILVYWLMMASYSLFGVGTFAARFFSGIAGASAILSTFLLGRTMFDRRAGLLAAWVLTLSPMVVVESKLCTADGVLFGFLTFGAYCLWRVASGAGPNWATAFWFALAFAGLTKGPVAAGVLGGTALAFSLIVRDFHWMRDLRIGRGFLILAVVLLPWCAAVQDATHGEFLAVALGRHVLERSTAALENHHGFPGYYVASLFLLMAPWSFALPWALHRLGRQLIVDRRLAFLLAWLLAPLLMFEAVRTKLVHYYLPAYPAAALLLAAAWAGRFAVAPFRASAPRQWFGWSTAAAGLVLAMLLGGGISCVFPAPLAVPGAIAVILFGSALVGSGLLLAWHRPRPAFRTLVCGLWAAFAVGTTAFLPAFGAARPIYEVANRLRAHRRETIGFWLYRDPSIIFNLGGGVYPVVDPLHYSAPLSEARALAEWTPFLCPLTPDLYKTMSADTELRLEIVETVEKWDPGTLRERTVHLVRVAPAADALAARSVTPRK